MSTNIEIEAKAMLDESDYQKLIKQNNLSSYTQINYYLDDEKISHQKQFGLRVRVKRNFIEFTLKVSVGDEKKIEINQVINEMELNAIIKNNLIPDGEVKDALISNKIDLTKMKVFGKLTTTRSDIKYKTSLISIDKNEYNNQIDYEIEAEDSSMEDAKNNLQEFLNKNMISYKENHVTKLKRLILSL